MTIDEVAKDVMALLGPAAAMLVEDAHLLLVTVPCTPRADAELAATITALGSDLSAIGAAAAVLARRAASNHQDGTTDA
jgi:hypothetical protein